MTRYNGRILDTFTNQARQIGVVGITFRSGYPSDLDAVVEYDSRFIKSEVAENLLRATVGCMGVIE